MFQAPLTYTSLTVLSKQVYKLAPLSAGGRASSHRERLRTRQRASTALQDSSRVPYHCPPPRSNLVYIIGGDGTMRGAMNIFQEVKGWKVSVSVVGIPHYPSSEDPPTVSHNTSFLVPTMQDRTLAGHAG
ncbi:hypothetical protein Taro_047188 [Colocasia esculenta]|uniref:Uncharacterized protein n=1 Tax=Colocasia esculenta TaxID=4460 RepID=A0A843X3H8_COLES|nr:hypothetical protein [Colocasia esculenta]